MTITACMIVLCLNSLRCFKFRFLFVKLKRHNDQEHLKLNPEFKYRT